MSSAVSDWLGGRWVRRNVQLPYDYHAAISNEQDGANYEVDAVFTTTANEPTDGDAVVNQAGKREKS